MNDPRPARPGDVEAIALVVADAFVDDPGAAIFESDRVRREAILPAFFGIHLSFSLHSA